MSAQPSFRSSVYGSPEVDLDDPAENYHEASKLYPALAERQAAGIVQLTQSPALLAATSRPVRRNRQLQTVDLPQPRKPDASLWSAIGRRRSARAFDGSPLALRTLSTLLHAGYGAQAEGRRTVPSGGALYPLELYVVARRIHDLELGAFHFDPERGLLETIRRADLSSDLDAASPLAGLAIDAAAVVLLSGVFWRTRAKYGLRGYRFTLLEAGHVVQNVLLAATALSVPALPLGGFYDSRLEELLGLDGVDESILYGVVLGGDPR